MLQSRLGIAFVVFWLVSGVGLAAAGAPKDPCAGRSGCGVVGRKAAGKSKEGVALEVVEVGLSANRGGCEEVEFWLLAGETATRLARACKTQGAPDTLGTAAAVVVGGAWNVNYREMRAKDQCAGAEVKLQLAPLGVLSERKWEGGKDGRSPCAPWNELITDAKTGAMTARWREATCDASTAAWGTRTFRGLVIPDVTAVAGKRSPQAALADCGVVLEPSSVRGVGGGNAGVRLRAARIENMLYVDVTRTGGKGPAPKGSVEVLYAGTSASQGVLGGASCATAKDAAPLVTDPIELAPTEGDPVEVKASPEGGWLITLELPPGTARLALRYEAPGGGTLASASLRQNPTSADLPPVLTVGPGDARCAPPEAATTTAAADPWLDLRALAR